MKRASEMRWWKNNGSFKALIFSQKMEKHAKNAICRKHWWQNDSHMKCFWLFVLVTQPECLKGAKDEVKSLKLSLNEPLNINFCFVLFTTTGYLHLHFHLNLHLNRSCTIHVVFWRTGPQSRMKKALEGLWSLRGLLVPV